MYLTGIPALSGPARSTSQYLSCYRFPALKPSLAITWENNFRTWSIPLQMFHSCYSHMTQLCAIITIVSICFHPFWSPHLLSIFEQPSWQQTEEMIFAHSSNSSVTYSFIIDKAHSMLLSINHLYRRH